MSDERIWDAISELQKNSAEMRGNVSALVKGVDSLVVEIRESRRLDNEARTKHEVDLARAQKDVDALGGKVRTTDQKIEKHEEGHRWFAGQVIIVVGILVAVIELAVTFWRK